MTTETRSQVYSWEPSNAQIAARYGLDPAYVLRFDTNTSPVGPDLVSEVLERSSELSINEYPDSSYAELTRAAADYVGVDPSEIVVAAGADEVLDLAAKARLAGGSRALVPAPTYGMYGVLTAQRGATMLGVPRLGPEQGFALDTPRVVESLGSVALVWLCSPNNPTGLAESDVALDTILDAAARLPEPPLVVVDEAYYEFSGTTLVPKMAACPNLLVVRTLSKAFALAGIRVGFGIAARPTIERLERVRPPGSISTLSAAIAAEALRRPGVAAENVARLHTERSWLVAQLSRAGWRPYPSVTNFLLLPIGDPVAARSLADRLLRAGIVPRDYRNGHPLADHLRLTVRARAENQRLLSVMGDALT